MGLLVLPAEVKVQILRLLGARDLAMASSSCAELRHMAEDDDLWAPLYRGEFRHVPEAEAGAEASRLGGWHAAFSARCATLRGWLAVRECHSGGLAHWIHSMRVLKL